MDRSLRSRGLRSSYFDSIHNFHHTFDIFEKKSPYSLFTLNRCINLVCGLPFSWVCIYLVKYLFSAGTFSRSPVCIYLVWRLLRPPKRCPIGKSEYNIARRDDETESAEGYRAWHFFSPLTDTTLYECKVDVHTVFHDCSTIYSIYLIHHPTNDTALLFN